MEEGREGIKKEKMKAMQELISSTPVFRFLR